MMVIYPKSSYPNFIDESKKIGRKAMATAITQIKNSIPESLPFLEAVCWQTENVYRFEPDQMLNRYERGWRYRNMFDNLEGKELDFLKQLANHYNSWLQSDL